MRKEIRVALTSFVAASALGGVYMTLPLAFPDAPKWVWQIVLLVAVACFAVSILILDYALPASRKPRMLALAGMIVCGIGFIGFTGYYLWPAKIKKVANEMAVLQTGNPLDNEISLDCNLSKPPMHFLEDKYLKIFRLTEPPAYEGLPAPQAGELLTIAPGNALINWHGLIKWFGLSGTTRQMARLQSAF